MSATKERAISVIKPSPDGRWVARVFGVTGKRRRLAIVARGSLDYTRRVSALYGALTLEVDDRPPMAALVADTSCATNDNDCEVAR